MGVITDQEARDYRELLNSNKSLIKKYYPLLSCSQQRMLSCSFCIAFSDREYTIKDYMRMSGVSRRAVYRVIGLIKKRRLTFRTSVRLVARLIEKEFFGASTDLGKMTEDAIRMRHSRKKKK